MGIITSDDSELCSRNQQQLFMQLLRLGDLDRRSWMPSPSIAEQRAIADFLDERTGKLDALAEKKRALIEKLKEKRSALISRTVTKGLPAEAAAQAGLPTHPKLKPSGIDWLGDIPEHWDVILALRTFGYIHYRLAESRQSIDEGLPTCYRATDGVMLRGARSFTMKLLSCVMSPSSR